MGRESYRSPKIIEVESEGATPIRDALRTTLKFVGSTVATGFLFFVPFVPAQAPTSADICNHAGYNYVLTNNERPNLIELNGGTARFSVETSSVGSITAGNAITGSIIQSYGGYALDGLGIVGAWVVLIAGAVVVGSVTKKKDNINSGRQKRDYEDAVALMESTGSAEATVMVASHQSISEEMAIHLASLKNSDVAMALIGNSNITEDARIKLLDHPDPYVVRELVRRIHLHKVEVHDPIASTKMMNALGSHTNPEVAMAVLAQLFIPSDIFTMLASTHTNQGVLKAILSSPYATSEARDIIALKGSTESIKELLKSRKISEWGLAKLAEYDDLEIVMAVAGGRAYPETLDRLASHENKAVVLKVAENERTSSTTLARLALSLNEEILHAVAKNQNTSSETLDRLASRGSAAVMIAVAGNRNATADTLDRLVSRGSVAAMRVVAKNERTSADTLNSLASSTDVHIIDAVTRHKNTSPGTLDRMASTDEFTAKRVAGNPRAYVSTLARLASHPSLDVVVEVAGNSNTSEETLIRLASHSNIAVVSVVAGNRNTPHKTLSKLTRHSDPRVLEVLAGNPALSDRQLMRLDTNPNAAVREQARRQLRHRNEREEATRRAKIAANKGQWERQQQLAAERRNRPEAPRDGTM